MIVVINNVQQLLVSLQILAHLREHFGHFFCRTLLAYSRGIGNDVLYIVLLFQNRHNVCDFALICIFIKQDHCVIFWENICDRVFLGQCINGFRSVLQIACADKQHNEQYRNNATETVAETTQNRRRSVLIRFFRPFFLFGLFNQFMRQ